MHRPVLAYYASDRLCTIIMNSLILNSNSNGLSYCDTEMTEYACIIRLQTVNTQIMDLVCIDLQRMGAHHPNLHHTQRSICVLGV